MKKLWFVRKSYGWGWTPSSWEGWLTILIFVMLGVANFYRIDAVSHSSSDTLVSFVPETLIMSLILIIICYLKGESPRWHWGNKTDKK